jgi:hypothetical protein
VIVACLLSPVYQASLVCAVTGLPARYRDPLTRMPYHDASAFKTLRADHHHHLLLRQQQQRSGQPHSAARKARSRAQPPPASPTAPVSSADNTCTIVTSSPSASIIAKGKGKGASIAKGKGKGGGGGTDTAVAGTGTGTGTGAGTKVLKKRGRKPKVSAAVEIPDTQILSGDGGVATSSVHTISGCSSECVGSSNDHNEKLLDEAADGCCDSIALGVAYFSSK